LKLQVAHQLGDSSQLDIQLQDPDTNQSTTLVLHGEQTLLGHLLKNGANIGLVDPQVHEIGNGEFVLGFGHQTMVFRLGDTSDQEDVMVAPASTGLKHHVPKNDSVLCYCYGIAFKS
jgi:hypothetical protein